MKRTKDLKTNKGITLIALVITIIVMLILVGVTISMAVNGGLFSQAGEATGKTKNAINAEQELANGGVEVGEVKYNSIDEYLRKITIVGNSSEVHVRDKIKLGVKSNGGTISSEYVVVWTSSDEDIATVNENGEVLGVEVEEGQDEATVTITAELKKDDITVEVATKEIIVKPIECTACEHGYIIDTDLEIPECPMVRGSTEIMILM